MTFKIGLGVTGGIAAYKAVEVLRLLQKAGCDVSVAMTRHATLRMWSEGSNETVFEFL